MGKKKESEKIILETFSDPRGYWLSNFNQNDPSCHNGIVRVEKWRITVEKVEEPKEVIEERLEYLFRNANNYHHYNPLQRKAKEIGYKFTGRFGQDQER